MLLEGEGRAMKPLRVSLTLAIVGTIAGAAFFLNPSPAVSQASSGWLSPPAQYPQTTRVMAPTGPNGSTSIQVVDSGSIVVDGHVLHFVRPTFYFGGRSSG